jgi:hypothetical protein
MNDSGTDSVVVEESGRYPGVFRGNGPDGFELTRDHAVSGKIAGAFQFDGAVDNVDFGTSISTVLAGDFAVAGWFRATAPVDKNRAVFSKRNVSEPYQGISVYLAGDGKGMDGQLVAWVGLSQDNDLVVASPQRLDDGNWHHFVAQREGNSLRLFIDGEESHQESVSGGEADVSNSDHGYLGRDDVAADKWLGDLDDMRLFRRSLVTKEISGLYNHGNGTEDNCNHTPVFSESSIAIGYVASGKAWQMSLADQVQDPDTGDSVTFLSLDGPAWLALSEQGVLSGTPDINVLGENTWTVTVSDNHGDVNRVIVQMVVVRNSDPEFVSNPLRKRDAMVDWPYSDSLVTDVRDSDLADGDVLHFAKVAGPEWLTVLADGTLTGIPAQGDLGENSFEVRVSDRTGASVSAQVQVRVVDFLAVESVTNPAWVEQSITPAVKTVQVSVNGGAFFDTVRESSNAFYVDNASASGRALGVLLQPQAPTDLVFSAGSAGDTTRTMRQSIAWKALDLGVQPPDASLTIRRGDCLLLTSTGAGVPLEIDSNGDGVPEFSGQAGEKFEALYATPGAYRATALIGGRPVGTLLVRVLDVDLRAPIACSVDYTRDKTVGIAAASMPDALFFRSADSGRMTVGVSSLTGNEAALKLCPKVKGETALQARLGGAQGPILASAPVTGFEVRSTAETYIAPTSIFLDGSLLISPVITMDPYIPGLEFRFHIISSGTTFLDSTTDLIAPSDQFKEGRYSFSMIKTSRAICHSRRVYQAGIPISR